MHQNKPTAPIKYTNLKGQTVLVDKDTVDKVALELPLFLTLKDTAVLQTCVNRSLFNCNCDLDKSVLKGIVQNINYNLSIFEEGEMPNDLDFGIETVFDKEEPK